MDSTIYSLVFLPILILVSRILDVSLQTLRIVSISNGYKKIAPIIGFFEVFIWIAVMGQLFENVNNFYYYLIYAGGFAIGSYFGMLIDQKIGMGHLSLKVLLEKDIIELSEILKSISGGFVSLKSSNELNKGVLLIMVIRRKELENVKRTILKFDEKAFLTFEKVDNFDKNLIKKPNKVSFFAKKRKVNAI